MGARWRHRRNQQTATAVVSKRTFIATILLVAVIAFALGTRGNEIAAMVGPVFGFKVPHGTIDLSSVQKTYQQLNANYDGKLDTRALIVGANKGLVSAAGDKFTQYLDAKEAAAFSNDLSGNIGAGIGVEIASRNNVPTITQLLPNNPAAKAGLQVDDQIIAVNRTSMEGKTVADVAAAVRGKSNTKVEVTINRGGNQQTYVLTRQTINNPSVTGEVKNGIGIMTIGRFDDKTGTLARQVALDFKKQNVHAVVVDLRDNGGGYVDAAQAVASLWLDQKTVVLEKQSNNITSTITSENNPVLEGMKTIVLVNQNTASASEIVSGALQDYGVATLVGTKTYGKGTMQQVIGLNDGAELKVTIAHWFTPKDRGINAKGLTPNTIVDITAEQISAGQDPQLDTAIRLAE